MNRFIDFYWQLRVVPYAVKHMLGRWYVLRDAPDGVVSWLARAYADALADDSDRDDDLLSLMAEGARELEVRAQRHRRNAEQSGRSQ